MRKFDNWYVRLRAAHLLFSSSLVTAENVHDGSKLLLRPLYAVVNSILDILEHALCGIGSLRVADASLVLNINGINAIVV